MPFAPEAIDALARDGYLHVPGLVADRLDGLREAIEVVADAERDRSVVQTGKGFGGIFLRHLMDKHPAFLALFRFAPTLGLARATLGPMVRVLPMTGRIAVPGEPNQQTEWHIHQRVVPVPLPPFFGAPTVLDALLYLDDVDEVNGPLGVVPGSHRWIHREIPDKWGELEGETRLMPKAGDAVIVHGNVWHRALPTLPEGKRRRLLILPYTASWNVLPSFGERPANGLMRPLYENPDRETKELLGLVEGLY